MEAVLARGSNSVHDKTGHHHISFWGLQGNFGVERLGTALLARTQPYLRLRGPTRAYCALLAHLLGDELLTSGEP